MNEYYWILLNLLIFFVVYLGAFMILLKIQERKDDRKSAKFWYGLHKKLYEKYNEKFEGTKIEGFYKKLGA